MRTGAAVESEEDPVDASLTGAMRANVAAIGHLEEAVLGATWTEGIALRYGWFYGPGTSMDRQPRQAGSPRARGRSQGAAAGGDMNSAALRGAPS